MCRDSTAEQTTPTQSANMMVPLAELVRPTSMDEFVGQEDVIGKNSFLRTILETGDVPSLIFWGPPGCGKVSSSYNTHQGPSFNITHDIVEVSHSLIFSSSILTISCQN